MESEKEMGEGKRSVDLEQLLLNIYSFKLTRSGEVYMYIAQIEVTSITKIPAEMKWNEKRTSSERNEMN